MSILNCPFIAPPHTHKQTKTKADKDAKATGMLSPCCWECKMVQLLWKTVWQFLTKLNVVSSYDPAVIFLGIYQINLKTYPHKGQHPNVYRGFFSELQKPQAIKMSFNR